MADVAQNRAEYIRALYGVLTREGFRGLDLEQAVEAAFLRACSIGDKCHGEARPFMIVVAQNVAKEIRKRRARWIKVQSMLDSAGVGWLTRRWDDAPPVDPVRMAMGQDLLDRLDALRREAYVLYHHEGLTLAEIGQRIGVHHTTVRNRIIEAQKIIDSAREEAE